MAKFNGTNFKASITGTPNKTIADSRDLSISVADEELDVTTRDSGGWKETIMGVRSWSASLSGVVDFVEGTNEAGVTSLMNLAIGRAPIALLFGTTTTGDQTYSGSGYIMTVDISAPYEGVVEWTAEISGNGALISAVVA